MSFPCNYNKNLFEPPLNIQRHLFVRKYLVDNAESLELKSVCDLGSNNCRLSMYLKRLQFLEKILCVDISQENLSNSLYNAGPTIMDRLLDRQNKLVVELYQASVLERDHRISNVDVITCIELIEHLQLETVHLLEDNVFGFIKPRIAIFSTPNFEYNKLIKTEAAKNVCTNEECYHIVRPDMLFRDDDHKFEWTRAEFKVWCDGITSKYQDYSYELDGVGRLKSDVDFVTGYATQIAIFTKLDNVINDSGNNNNDIDTDVINDEETSESCSLYCSYNYG